VSARKTRLQQQAEAGMAGAQSALDLANAPSNLLSTVQIGITLVGILAGAFGGATLAGKLAVLLGRIEFLQAYANTLSVAIVVVFITYLSLVIGELAPKQVGLAHAERVAAMMAPPMIFLSKLTAPIVAFLNLSTSALLRIFQFRPSTEPEITEEEIKIVIEQGTETGVLQPIEEEIVSQVFRLSDQRISTLMTPRREVTWIDLDDPIETIKETLATGAYSQYPVAHDNLDDVIGSVQAKDLLAQCVAGRPLDLISVMQPALFIPENMPVYTALEQFKQHKTQMALVIDEFGGVQGMVSTSDILEEIVGEFPDIYASSDPVSYSVKTARGCWMG
jgi:putative hemolysin